MSSSKDFSKEIISKDPLALLALKFLNAACLGWYFIQIGIVIAGMVVSGINGESAKNLFNYNNLNALAVYGCYSAAFIVSLVYLFKNKLTVAKAGILALIIYAIQFYNTISPFFVLRSDMIQMLMRSIVVNVVRMALVIAGTAVIYFVKRRLLGVHIAFYIFQALIIIALIGASIQNAAVAPATYLIGNIFSALLAVLMIFQAVLVLIKKTKAINK